MVVNVALFCGFLIALIVTAFFLWQTLLGSQSHNSPHAQGADSEQQGANKNSSGTSVAPAHNNPAEEAIAEYTRWLAFFTAALVLATIALFISGERNVEAARESAGAASRSANAALKSVELAEQTAQRQLRAYIVVDKGAVILNGSNLRATIEIKNSGQTPAYDLTTSSRTFIWGTQPFDGVLETPTSFGVSIVGPGGDRVVESAIEIPAQPAGILEALKAGRGPFIYVLGRTEYRDIFRKPHVLHFLMRSQRFEGNHWILENTENGNREE